MSLPGACSCEDPEVSLLDYWQSGEAFLSGYRCDEGYFLAIQALAERAKRSVGHA